MYLDGLVILNGCSWAMAITWEDVLLGRSRTSDPSILDLDHLTLYCEALCLFFDFLLTMVIFGWWGYRFQNFTARQTMGLKHTVAPGALNFCDDYLPR